MEFLITFLVIFVGSIWILGKILPRLLAWYLKKKLTKMGGDGASFGSFGNNGFAGFWNAGGFGQPQGEDLATAARIKEEQIRRSKEQEGQVKIVQQEQPEKVIERNMGEYVDYEEEKS